MNNNSLGWEILNKKPIKNNADVINVLLRNRGIKTEKEKKQFLDPKWPDRLSLEELNIQGSQVVKASRRIRKAIKNGEKIIIYGDYDTDGVCATAILWECLYSLTKNVTPYIPDRFSEGYGLNVDSISRLKTKDSKLKLIITVDNGIVANEAVDVANKLGIDIIITDHHQKAKKLPKAHSIIHTTKIGGAGIAWILAREIRKSIKYQVSSIKGNSLELAGVGTISDQLPLLGPNRSFAKYGLEALRKTKRPGLLALFEEAGIKRESIGTYEINFVIAPRLNAMGRMEHAIESLRLLCTTSPKRARELAHLLGSTNEKRQKIVEGVISHARETASKKEWRGVIVVAHETYHEGVVGLAASKLVEEFYRPTIVFSKGKETSKASARSIAGFNIIEVIRKLDYLTIGAGGHPMAAGFSIKTEKLEAFFEGLEKISTPLLTENILQKKLKVDMDLRFNQINQDLVEKLHKFEPTGMGNPKPVFAAKRVNVLGVRTIGSQAKHLKLALKDNGANFNSVAFGLGYLYSKFTRDGLVDVAFSVEENVWNGNKNIELKIKDLKIK